MKWSLPNRLPPFPAKVNRTGIACVIRARACGDSDAPTASFDVERTRRTRHAGTAAYNSGGVTFAGKGGNRFGKLHFTRECLVHPAFDPQKSVGALRVVELHRAEEIDDRHGIIIRIGRDEGRELERVHFAFANHRAGFAFKLNRGAAERARIAFAL